MPRVFLAPGEIRRDLDAPFVSRLAAPERLVFVLGLHRSGTTWLYELLAAAFPFAVTRLYDVTHYRRLLYAVENGLEGAYQAALDRHLQALGVETRGTDEIRVHAHGLEEYAFILRRFTPHWGFTPATAPLVDEVLRKLAAVQPGTRGVLVKNPHDLGAIARLHATYPHARFVIIRRDPVRVLDSQLRAGLRYRRAPAYLDLLMAAIPGWQAFLPCWQATRVLAPDPLYERFLLGMLQDDIARELSAHHRALGVVPREVYVELEYGALVRDPAAAVASVEHLLGLPPRPGFVPAAAAPRERAVRPLVAGAAGAFRRRLASFPDAGLVEP